MSSISLSTAVELSRRLYPDGLEEILYKKSPAWGMIEKWKNFKQEGKFLVWQFAVNAGASSRFANAQANKSAGSYAKPFINRRTEYALASMDGQAMDALDGDPASIGSVFKSAMDSALYNIRQSVSFHAFRNGGGARAQIASGSTTDTVTLTSTSSVQGLEKGMVLNAALTDGTTGAVLSGTPVVVQAVDRQARTVRAQAAWNTLIPGITDASYLFRDGDFGNVIHGFQAWIPDSVPSPGENFFGIDRSGDTRLHGLRYAPTSGTIEEILINASAIAMDNGADPDLVILNPLDMANLVNSLGSKRVHVDAKSPSKPTVGYDGVVLMGAAGKMTVLADPMCQRYKAWMLTQSTWQDWCLGEVPRILDRDGNQSLREASADADELRLGAYLERVCLNPNANMNITLPS